MFPHISDLRFIRPNNESLSVDVETSNPMEWKILERDHKAYASLIQAFTKSKDNPKDCIACVIGASSTDRDPEESVVHTLFPIDRYMWGGSYWSSKGQTNPDVPETLIYKLISDVCVVTEIDIRPFAGDYSAFFNFSSSFIDFLSVNFMYTSCLKTIRCLSLTVFCITLQSIGSLEVPFTQRSLCDSEWVISNPQGRMG